MLKQDGREGCCVADEGGNLVQTTRFEQSLPKHKKRTKPKAVHTDFSEQSMSIYIVHSINKIIILKKSQTISVGALKIRNAIHTLKPTKFKANIV